MDKELFQQMVTSVFSPKRDERIVLVYDVPTASIKDHMRWKRRRDLVETWYSFLKEISLTKGFSVETLSVPATGEMNAPLFPEVLDQLNEFDVLIALTEFSMTSSLISLVQRHPGRMRCASMPQAEPRMMETVFAMDYSRVKQNAHRIKNLLEDAVRARVFFSTDDILDIDLRGRHAGADDGDCTFPGACINLPSGEGFIAPYEGVEEEQSMFGQSRTQGILPFVSDGNILRCEVKHNRIVDIGGQEELPSKMDLFFDEEVNRRNIAELGIGCNPKAQVTGNFIEDEKAGVHIAYGTSRHLGGKITSDLHHDIIYAKGCPITAEKVVLFFDADDSVELVKDAMVDYDLLR